MTQMCAPCWWLNRVVFQFISIHAHVVLLQVHSMITKLAQFTDVRTALVVGGLSLQVQATTLRSSPEIVVATPVRS